MAGELHRQIPNAATGAEHEHRIALVDCSMTKECLPRGQPGQRYPRRRDMTDASWPNGQVAGLDRDQLRGGAVAIPVSEAIDLVTDADAGRAKAQARYDTLKLMAGDDGRSIVTAAIDPRRRPLQLAGCVAGGVYFDQCVTGTGPGAGADS